MQIDIDQFIAAHELDASAKEELIDLVNKCFTKYVTHMSSDWLQAEVHVPSKKGTAKKGALKTEKLESIDDAESLEQLISTACTTALLSEYCRENGLRIGGNKKDAAGRVWRHKTGETTDDDISPRSKPKKVVAKKEVHQCFACNAKGQPCGLAADNQHDSEWFCFRHIDTADEIIEAKKVPVPKAKPSVSKKPAASLKKKAPVEEEELEEEE